MDSELYKIPSEQYRSAAKGEKKGKARCGKKTHPETCSPFFDTKLLFPYTKNQHAGRSLRGDKNAGTG